MSAFVDYNTYKAVHAEYLDGKMCYDEFRRRTWRFAPSYEGPYYGCAKCPNKDECARRYTS